MQTLQNGYPRLLRLIKDLFARIRVVRGLSSSDTSQSDHESALLRSLSPLATAYLQRSSSRMHDPINLAFASGGAGRGPARDDADRVVRIISGELEQARFDRGLLRSVGKNAGKAVHAFATKAESVLDLSELSPNLNSLSTPGFQAALDVLNALFTLDEGMWKVLEGYEVDSGLAEEIGPALGLCRSVAVRGVKILFASLGREMEVVMGKVHKEDYWKWVLRSKKTWHTREVC